MTAGGFISNINKYSIFFLRNWSKRVFSQANIRGWRSQQENRERDCQFSEKRTEKIYAKGKTVDFSLDCHVKNLFQVLVVVKMQGEEERGGGSGGALIRGSRRLDFPGKAKRGRRGGVCPGVVRWRVSQEPQLSSMQIFFYSFPLKWNAKILCRKTGDKKTPIPPWLFQVIPEKRRIFFSFSPGNRRLPRYCYIKRQMTKI